VPVELERIWAPIRQELRREAPDFRFHIWLDPLALVGVEQRTLYIQAPEHIRTWVMERYLPVLRAAAVRQFDPRAVVQIVPEGWHPPDDTTSSPVSDSPGGVPRGRLNPKYTFEQFVIGGGNRFAHAAALAVAELPGQAYNPLFLHGPPGLGKTHLLHAIGNYVRRYGSGLQVRYATVEEFTSEFVDAVRGGETRAFKERFRQTDVVLIDDVQFLARKDRTREEFFHTFDSLYDSGRQLVMTSDRCPEELPELEDRLAERFRCGLVVGLDPPAREVRRAILEKRARLDGVELPRDVLDEIANSVTSSVRALEGALVRVVAYASLRDESPTPALVRRALWRFGHSQAPPRACALREIVDAVAREFGVTREAMLARDRRSVVATARHVAMYLARRLTDHSLHDIGSQLGGRNHATVLHAVNRIDNALESDGRIRSVVDNLTAQLGRSM
jgi:chromosomal replication initiator protein